MQNSNIQTLQAGGGWRIQHERVVASMGTASKSAEVPTGRGQRQYGVRYGVSMVPVCCGWQECSQARAGAAHILNIAGKGTGQGRNENNHQNNNFVNHVNHVTTFPSLGSPAAVPMDVSQPPTLYAACSSSYTAQHSTGGISPCMPPAPPHTPPLPVAQLAGPGWSAGQGLHGVSGRWQLGVKKNLP